MDGRPLTGDLRASGRPPGQVHPAAQSPRSAASGSAAPRGAGPRAGAPRSSGSNTSAPRVVGWSSDSRRDRPDRGDAPRGGAPRSFTPRHRRPQWCTARGWSVARQLARWRAEGRGCRRPSVRAAIRWGLPAPVMADAPHVEMTDQVDPSQLRHVPAQTATIPTARPTVRRVTATGADRNGLPPEALRVIVRAGVTGLDPRPRAQTHGVLVPRLRASGHRGQRRLAHALHVWAISARAGPAMTARAMTARAMTARAMTRGAPAVSAHVMTLRSATRHPAAGGSGGTLRHPIVLQPEPAQGAWRDRPAAEAATRPAPRSPGVWREAPRSGGERPSSSDRQSYDRPARTERPAYNDRPARTERPAYNDRPARTERPGLQRSSGAD